MPLILPSNSISDLGFSVANSLRFDTQSTESLKFTPSTYSSSTTGTFSFWIKRGLLSNEGSTVIWSNTYTNDNNRTYISINSSDQLGTSVQFSGSDLNTYTNMVLRDTSAWYHCVIRYNSTESTQSDRVKIWVNGELQSLSSSGGTPTGSITAFQTSLSNTHAWNFIYNSSSGLQNAYLSQCVYCDGQSYSASDFGEYDEDSGIWKPKDLSTLTFGNNGYWLDYGNSGSLGADVSGNGNNFTASGFSADNQVTDTPTNNFATMNPLDNYYANSTFSEGNLKLVQGSSTYAHNLSTIAVTNGKWYAEAKLTTDSDHALVGITDRSPVQALNDILGSNSFDYSIKKSNGDLFNNRGTNPSNDATDYAGAYAQNDIIGIALDLDNNKLYFSKGGQWSNGSGAWDSTTFNSSTGAITITAPASTNNGHYFFASGDYGGAVVNWEWNFGNPPYTISSGNTDGNGYGNMEFSVPSGYYVLNSKNLAEYGG